MLVLIYDDQLAGLTEQTENLPLGFTVVEAPDLPLEALYWDGEAVLPKPERPSPGHFWDVRLSQWVDANAAEPVATTLEAAIAQKRREAGAYWNSKIEALTSGYPASEVASWTELKSQAEAFVASQDFEAATPLYYEVMLRQFGAEATPEYCDGFRQQYPEGAVELVTGFAELILANGQRLVAGLTQFKGLRGYHWEQIGQLESVEQVQDYDFMAEGDA